MDSVFADGPVSRKSTTGLVAQIGKHTVKTGCRLQSLTALSVGEAEFYAVVKGGSSSISPEIYAQRSGNLYEIQSDSSTANSLTDRLGAGQRTKHIDTRFFLDKNEFKTETSVSRRCPQRKTAQMLERSQSLLQ